MQGSAFQSLAIGVWEETVLINVSSSIRHLKWPFSLVPQNQNLNFLCSLLPKITFVPVFPSFLDLCSSEIYDIVPHNLLVRLNVVH